MPINFGRYYGITVVMEGTMKQKKKIYNFLQSE